jgi:WD40 repeat protein
VRLPIQNAKDGTPELGPASPIDPEKGFYIADVSRDGARAVLTSFMGGKCKIEALDGTAPVLRWDLPGAAGAAFVADDREVLVNSLEDSHGALLELRDAQTGALRRTLNYRHGAHVHVTADGAWALVGAGPDVSLLLRTSDWTPGPSLPTEVQGRGTQMAFSPDGAFMAFGDGDKVVLVRSSDGAVLADLQAPQSGTYLPGLAFSPDGARLALWWENGQLALWDLRTLRRELGARGLDW